MKKSLTLLLGTCLAVSLALADINFDVEADLLKNSSGSALGTSGLVILAASTQDASFGSILSGISLSTGSFLDGSDDMILWKGDLTGQSINGLLLETSVTIPLAGNWTQNDPLALYWFPTYTLSSTNTSSGDSYGRFSGPALNGSDLWTTPSDGTSSHNLYFFTTDAATLPAGSHPASSGEASLLVVPEPGGVGLILLGLSALIIVRLAGGQKRKNSIMRWQEEK